MGYQSLKNPRDYLIITYNSLNYSYYKRNEDEKSLDIYVI